MHPRRALLIVNRKARGGELDLAQGLDLLRRQGVDLREIYLENAAEIAEIIGRFASESDLVILGGGDGTINAGARALVQANLPLGILPMGTANDLARTLQIPTDLKEACRTIAEGHLHRIDLGEVNGHYFLNVASIGLGVQVTHQLTVDVKRRWGVFGYLKGLFGALRENRSFLAGIRCDGQSLRHRTIQVAVGNGRHYGGGMTISEEAQVDDGRLHLYSLQPQSFWSLIRLAPALRSGHYPDRAPVLLMSGKEITIDTRKAYRVDTDGELTTRTPARFKVVARTLPVFVPPHYLQGREEGPHVAQ